MAKRVRVAADFGASDDVFDDLARVLSGTGMKAQAMLHARKIFDGALVDTVSFEEALAHVYHEGFLVGVAHQPKPRRGKRKAKPNGDEAAAGDKAEF